MRLKFSSLVVSNSLMNQNDIPNIQATLADFYRPMMNLMKLFGNEIAKQLDDTRNTSRNCVGLQEKLAAFYVSFSLANIINKALDQSELCIYQPEKLAKA